VVPLPSPEKSPFAVSASPKLCRAAMAADMVAVEPDSFNQLPQLMREVELKP
jgi:hypothetical protein